MNKAATILKILAIIINALLCILLILAMVAGQVDGGYLVLMSLVVFAAALNVLILSLGRRLMVGAVGIVSIGGASILNGFSLFGVILGLIQYGMPGDLFTNLVVILWLIFPLITLPTLFIVRAQMKKGTSINTLTCPNCGTEIQTT